MREAISGQSGSHSRELEAARGVAILLVVLRHYTPFYFTREQIEQGLGVFSFIPHTGRTGVILFFVLSSYLLSRPFWIERAGGKQPSLPNFYSRRLLRIVPLFYLAVFAAFLWTSEGWAAMRSLLFISDDMLLKPFSGVWWSLRTEAQFYALLGFSVWVFRKPRWRSFYLAALAAYVACYLGLISGVFQSFGWKVDMFSGQVLLSIGNQWPAFAFGALISWLYVNWGEAWRESAAQSRWLGNGGGDLAMLSILFALGIALSSIESIGFSELLRNHGAWPLLEGSLWATAVLALLVLPLHTRRLIVNTPLEFLGRISYSLYLVHYPLNGLTGPIRYQARVAFFDTAERTLGIAAVEMTVSFALAVAFSWVTYRCIEMPFLSIKSRIGKQPPRKSRDENLAAN
jgi:peptidoglycan/LPS O-acetylase OafA/YrhL